MIRSKLNQATREGITMGKHSTDGTAKDHGDHHAGGAFKLGKHDRRVNDPKQVMVPDLVGRLAAERIIRDGKRR